MAQPCRPAANRPGAGGRVARVHTEGAVPEASRDGRAREQQNVRRIGTGRCTGGQDSRLGRGLGARYREATKSIAHEHAEVVQGRRHAAEP